MHEKHSPKEIHTYWFGTSLPEKEAIEERIKMWFTENEQVDSEIEEKYGKLVTLAGEGKLDHWKETPQGRLSLIILLDQFPRHIYRGTKEAFQYAELAEDLSLEGVSLGIDKSLNPFERAFFYLPLEHSEDLQLQNLCVNLFLELETEAPPYLLNECRTFTDYAKRHQIVIERFGRFPHRNEALDRLSTPEEIAFLAEGKPF